MLNPHESIFPFLDVISADETLGRPGLTKREYFATAALQGLMTGSLPIEHSKLSTPSAVAAFAVVLADALIVALNTPPEA